MLITELVDSGDMRLVLGVEEDKCDLALSEKLSRE